MPATTNEKSPKSVEDQLNALLTSGNADATAGAQDAQQVAAGTRKHTHLIENQLLTLEDQFWRNSSRVAAVDGKEAALDPQKRLSSALQAAVLESGESMALLEDASEGTTMSESTPVKRAMKVSVSGGSSLVREEDPGGGGNGQVPRLVTSQSSNLSRMKRFEQFLKSFVGKRPSSSSGITTSGTLDFETAEPFDRPALKVRSNMEIKNAATDAGPGSESQQTPAPVTMRRPSYGSMTSLNTAVQQKFFNILPSSSSALSLKRNLSANNLNMIPKRTPARKLAGCDGAVDRGTAARRLKTVSCSNFGQLPEVEDSESVGDSAARMSGDDGDHKEAGHDTEGRRDSLHSWRLKVSKSVNHLQSVSLANGGPLRPLNRFRNSLMDYSQSQLNLVPESQCSRCSSILSLAGGTMNKVRCSDSSVTDESLKRVSCSAMEAKDEAVDAVPAVVMAAGSSSGAGSQTCKLCLGEVSPQLLTGISQCGCQFCSDCMRAYIEFEILEGAYEISCPDAMCPAQGVVNMAEIAALTSLDLLIKHNRYRLNREVELDRNRTWCPRAGCDTVCLVDRGVQLAASTSAAATINAISPSTSSTSGVGGGNKNATIVAFAVRCPTCDDEFCCACKKEWHPRISCEENMKKLAADGHVLGIPFDSDLIKCCPMCGVPIEKDEGCAQMMCKRCKHVFCWYCLASLDDDFLLRHYDKGPCKNKLGHSRASVVWHRAQVIGIFAGFGILLLVASPLLLLAAPCIVCCKCRICSGGPKIEEEIDFDDPLTPQRS